jgi:hypothetical protein
MYKNPFIKVKNHNNNSDKKEPRVFMLMPHKLDVSKATEYGKIKMIFDGVQKKPSIWTPEFVKETLDRLEDMEYDPSTDYFLVVGSMVSVVRSTTALVSSCTVLPKGLFYDISSGKYVPLTMGVENE